MTRVTLLLYLTALQGLAGSPPRHTTPLKDQVALSLSADRQIYFVGELVRLSIRAKNTSSRPVSAFLALHPVREDVEVLARKAGIPFARLTDQPWKRRHSAEGCRTLQPSDEVVADADLSVIAVEADAPAFLLSEPGRWEFMVRYRDTSQDANGVLESQILAVDVIDPPAEEAAAAIAYTPDLAYVAQFYVGRSYLSPEVTRAAADFIGRFPPSRFAPPVREGLRRSLAYRLRVGVATGEERMLHQRLFSDSVAPALSLSVSPTRLWPPNHKLAPIAVDVRVSDDKDPSPSVKLVS